MPRPVRGGAKVRGANVRKIRGGALHGKGKDRVKSTRRHQWMAMHAAAAKPPPAPAK